MLEPYPTKHLSLVLIFEYAVQTSSKVPTYNTYQLLVNVFKHDPLELSTEVGISGNRAERLVLEPFIITLAKYKHRDYARPASGGL